MAGPAAHSPHPAGSATISIEGTEPISKEALQGLGELYLKLRPCTLMPALLALEAGVIDANDVKNCVDRWLFGVNFRDPAEQTTWNETWRRTHGNEDPPWWANR